MDEAKEVLRREAQRIRAPVDPIPAILRRLARRRARRKAGAAVAAFVVAGAGVLLLYTAFGGLQRRPASQPASPFPGAYREGENMVMPIAFLNGTKAEMVYPAHLALEKTGIQPAGSLYEGVPDFQIGSLRGKFVVRHDPSGAVTPLESFDPPQDGIVRRWKAEPTPASQTFRLGAWLAEVRDVDLTEEQREVFLQHLFGLETEAGFLILETTPPIQLWEGDIVAQLYFDIDDLTVMDRCLDFSKSADESFMQNGIRVYRTVEGADVGVDHLSWCDRSGLFGVGIREGPVADALIEGLSFRTIRHAEP